MSGTSTAAFIMINKILGLFFLPQAQIPLAILSLALLMLDFLVKLRFFITHHYLELSVASGFAIDLASH